VFKDVLAWFHWSGITPALSQSAAEACLEAVTAAYKLGPTFISCDFNYRSKLWQIWQNPERLRLSFLSLKKYTPMLF